MVEPAGSDGDSAAFDLQRKLQYNHEHNIGVC